MNNGDITRDHSEHPEDLLATYVDGEASDAERADVEELLSSCTECRMEVDLAVQARAALQSLPQLQAPELRAEHLAPSAATTGQRPSSRRGVLSRVREWGWERLAWGAALVAAGSLVALFVLVQWGGGSLQQQTTGGPRTTAGADSSLSEQGAPGYTPASLDALARRLVATKRATLAGGQSAPAPAAAQEESQQRTAAAGDRARDCLRRGGGLPPKARPVHVEEAAFRGTPAFIGAFDSGAAGGGRYLLVLAVNSRTCEALYVINRSL